MKGSTVVLATDLSEAAGVAAKWAHAFASAYGLKVVATHVVTISMSHWAEGAYDVIEQPEMMAKARANIARWYRDATGGEPDEVDVRVGHAPVQLREAVAEHDAAMLVLATSGKGPWQQVLLGSTAQSMASEPPCPVFIVPHAHEHLSDTPTIAVGIDFSANGAVALDFGARLARTLGAQLHLVHADTSPVIDVIDRQDLPPRFLSDGHYEWAEEEMTALVEAHRSTLDKLDYQTHIIEDYPSRGLIDFADAHDIDLLVVGRSGHSKLMGALVGGVLLKVLQSTPTTTVIVPGEPTED